ncbi:hypothetical protein JQX13_26350 [Archangium violaceum]|uniref:hypothetical protein n=1 Tax=Archangium violaceum TaxID=83451 RepID=UPI00193BBC0E|nr:hypothetical protein [Archangium violaceum]QRK13241.1 hypothetical protein JQX13_26350 [Archangium violaceum]
MNDSPSFRYSHAHSGSPLAALLGLTLGCSPVPETVPLEIPFGAFNFTIDSRPASEQIALLDGIGYQGMALYWPGVEAFEAFAAEPAVRQGRFRMLAVLYDLRFDTPWSREEMDTILHTFGIGQPPEEHFRRSYATWRTMSREVAATLTGQCAETVSKDSKRRTRARTRLGVDG